MFVKLTRSGPRSYVQFVESYRDESGKPRQRTIATVGRLDETGGAVQSLLSGLLRATGQPAASTGTMAPAAPGTPSCDNDSGWGATKKFLRSGALDSWVVTTHARFG